MEGRPRLESWKEISLYLQRSVKTCQRWEVELGLPIHRLDGTPSARVFANPDELDAWISEKLSHIRERPGTAPMPPRRLGKLLGAVMRPAVILPGVAVLLAVGGGLAWKLFLTSAPVFPKDTPSVFILPFENGPGDEALDPWKTALPRLITIDLLQSRAVGTWTTPRVLRALAGLNIPLGPKFPDESLKKLGERSGATALATGTLNRSGRGLVLELSLRDPATAAVTRTLRASCSEERGVFAMVDRLTRDIKRALGVPGRLISADIDEKAARISTASPEAFKLFCRGELLAGQAKQPEANQAFESALKIDVGFAEARLYLYYQARNAGAAAESLEIGQEILGSIDRLNAVSRYRFEADYYENVQEDIPKCLAALKSAWELIEDEVSGHQLADWLYGLERFEQALPILEALIKENPRNPDYYGHLAYCYVAQGRLDQAEQTIDGYLAGLGPADPPVELLWSRSDIALEQKKYDAALGFLDRQHSLYPRSPYAVRYSNATVYLTRDDLDLAEKEYQKIANDGTREQRTFGFRLLMGVCLTRGRIGEAMVHARSALAAAEDFDEARYIKEAHYYLANLHRILGRLPQALEEAELACRDYQEDGPFAVRPLQLKAQILLELGRTDDFSRLLAEIKRYIEKKQNFRLIRAYHYLLGAQELRQKNGAKAVEHLWQAVTLLPPTACNQQYDADIVQYWYALGEAYDLATNCVDAEIAFRKAPPYWDQRYGSGHLYALSFYRAARLEELCGRHPLLSVRETIAEKTSALTNYRKFLALWKDADPMFAPDVEDARARVAALEAELAGATPARAK